jgi:HAD superfamily hydrolase (TIGR01509 family)
LIFGKKVIIWDLDNTLYKETPEFADLLDETMAKALIEDFNIPMTLMECKERVKESYRIYRDGGELFYKEYHISQKELSDAYHFRKPVDKIIPYEDLANKMSLLDAEQYIFTASNRYASERILKRIGLFDMFKDRFFSVEDFGQFNKNKDAEIYLQYCRKIGKNPEECLFVDDSYSNLEYAKQAGLTTVRIYYQNNSAKDKTYIDMAFKGLDGFLTAALDK